MDSIKDMIEQAKIIQKDICEYKSFCMEKAYQKVEKRIVASCKRQLYIQYFSKVAVVLLFPLLMSTIIFVYLFINSTESEDSITFLSVNSAPGLVTQLELPDQSKVWLNAGSSLRYPSSFIKNKREVYLTGEGYFEVKSDMNSPFFVIVNERIKVKAYGTKFNVNSYMEDIQFETVLEKGKVDVVIDNKQVTLNESESLSFDKEKKKFSLSHVHTDEKTSWKDGRVIFRNASLEEVVKKLSRRYNIDIVLHRESNTDYKFRASFSTENITQILNYMELAAPIQWTFTAPEQLNDLSYKRQRIDLWLK